MLQVRTRRERAHPWQELTLNPLHVVCIRAVVPGETRDPECLSRVRTTLRAEDEEAILYCAEDPLLLRMQWHTFFEQFITKSYVS